ncbi:MAG: T9SS type A sorting domain-containing protein [Bacteroidia bacterium]
MSGISINIYDALGRKIITKQIQSGISQLDVSNLSRGIYFLEARTGKGIVSGKFFR